MARPLIVIDPQPRGLDEIFEPKVWARLESLGELAIHDGPGRMPAERFEVLLPEMALLIGQSDMPKARLDRAPKLRAIINVETNFLQNVDYETCFERGIHVLAPSSAFARPVAEMALGHGDRPLPRRDHRRPRDARGATRNGCSTARKGCFSLYGARVGLIGFGDLARAFMPLLAPFGCAVKAYDPWISDHFMAGFGVAAASLDEVLSTSQVIVVFAAVDQREPGFPRQTRIRADRAGLGLPADEPRRRGRFPGVPAPGRERAVPRRDRRLSRRAGAGRRSGAQGRGSAALASPRRRDDRFALEIGRQTVADAELILRGLPPLSCRRAQRETVARSRSKPIERS